MNQTIEQLRLHNEEHVKMQESLDDAEEGEDEEYAFDSVASD